MQKYEELTYLEQVRRLRSLAVKVLTFYNLKADNIKFIHHGDNTTFKVKSGKKSNL